MKAVKVKEIKSLLKTHSSVNWEDKPEIQFFKNIRTQQGELQLRGYLVLEIVYVSDSGDVNTDEEALEI